MTVRRRFGDLGICGVQRPGGPPGIGEVILARGWSPAPSDRFVFCEGFAEAPDGTSWAWELWTREEFERAGAGDGEVRVIAHLDLLAGMPAAAVVERRDDTGFRWAQVVVPVASFGPELLARLATASPAERPLIFSATRCPASHERRTGRPLG